MKKRVFLADLVYDTTKSNYVVPLNIAYLAACLEKLYLKDLDIQLFKYPTVLEQAIKSQPPDILGLSHYSWNSRLNSVFLDMVKRLNPNSVTVMGGPHIRPTESGLQSFLASHQSLDCYIPYEGEEPLIEFVGAVLGGNPKPIVTGCATLLGGLFYYSPVDFKKKPKFIDWPSPYLTGWLDSFLADSNMMPLLETNRGCPFNCVYCAWGIAALSKVRIRPLEMVLEEIDYIGERSAGQHAWMVCDGNFGILERDVVIAEKLRSIMNQKGTPSVFHVAYSKNATDRTAKIVDIICTGYATYSLQSADPVVLSNTGRTNMPIEGMKKLIAHAKQEGVETGTELLIGLPGESAQSHLNTLVTAFNIGFDHALPYNIRLLPGSIYETDEYREKYGVITKFRPISGAYGTYDGKRVVEVEESVRGTAAMSESELNNFKVHHWLMYFMWDMGFYKPLLQFGLQRGINPALVFDELAHINNSPLRSMFDTMKKQAMDEWFNSPEEMIKFYEQPSEYRKLVESFVKLNYLYVMQVYRNSDLMYQLQKETASIIRAKTANATADDYSAISELAVVSSVLICSDPLKDEFCTKHFLSGKVAAVIMNNPLLENMKFVTVEVYRPKEYAAMCCYYLMPNGKIDMSAPNFTRFLEYGRHTLKNKIRVVE